MTNFLIGLTYGIVCTFASFAFAFQLAARYQRTGRAEAPVAPEDRSPRTMPSPEASAMRQITADSLERGTDAILAAAKEQGLPMTRREALAQARAMIADAPPLGGVQ